MKIPSVQCLLALVPLLLAGLAPAGKAEEQKLPNIVWLVSEDNSAYLGAYGDPVARTPNLDRLAADGFVYEEAYATVGVCAPSRFSIITGRQPSSHYGSQGMRGGSPLPPEMHFFPKYLREAGYWTANGGKTDYNTYRDGAREEAWDDNKAHWRERPDPEQPFFKIFNAMTTHESRVFPPKDPARDRGSPKTDPASVSIPPYKPETPLAREDLAHYYDRMKQYDREVGTILDQLEEDGLADDTIVFYYSDHGGVLGRSKRFIYDSGTHVPLIVRFGKNVRHLAPDDAEDGRLSRLVSLMDLGPTVLSLAGVRPPDYMHGKAFLGSYAESPREYLMHPSQRFDERINLSRGIRDDRYLYIRNFFPHWPWGRHIAYMFRIPSTSEWYELWEAGDLPPEQARFFEPKGYEEFYDTETDPHQVNNLADDPAYAAELERLRQALDQRMIETEDTGFYWDFDHDDITLEQAMHQADTAARGDPANLGQLVEWLGAESPVTRFWAAAGLSILGPQAEPAHGEILAALERPDLEPETRVMLAEALCRMDDYDTAVSQFRTLFEDGGGGNTAALLALNVMQLNGPANFRELTPFIEQAAEGDMGNMAKWAAPRLLETMREANAGGTTVDL